MLTRIVKMVVVYGKYMVDSCRTGFTKWAFTAVFRGNAMAVGKSEGIGVHVKGVIIQKWP
ncbi:hypothetical protein [Cytobacillus dafuensis]|uniref:Uncharacterized protein n=1 Tax=Cytobacillus dafuensis TaxID=1742359 RepID=A0A5B8Z128_CYTDA|nr:hypothetical protein [Cytobacillus dafuensis]QED46511.1 hypothetical protein FSZ17_04060 [Cytobacillus dafuensis]